MDTSTSYSHLPLPKVFQEIGQRKLPPAIRRHPCPCLGKGLVTGAKGLRKGAKSLRKRMIAFREWQDKQEAARAKAERAAARRR